MGTKSRDLQKVLGSDQQNQEIEIFKQIAFSATLPWRSSAPWRDPTPPTYSALAPTAFPLQYQEDAI